MLPANPQRFYGATKDYFPDETARIFGYGFTPFSQVNVTVVRPDLNSDIIIANADEFGYFECQYQLDGGL